MPHDIHLSMTPASADVEPELRDLGAELRARAPHVELRIGRHDRMLYATDASMYQVEPLGVVLPRHVEDVAAVMQVAAARGLPIVPRGGGTSLAGQAVNRGLVIDFSKYCRRITLLDAEQQHITVEPGVVLAQLNEMLMPHGLMFGPDVATASHATLGGMIGNNSAGAHSILYGRTVEHLLNMQCVTAQGESLHFAPGVHGGLVDQMTLAVAEIVKARASLIRERFPTITRHVDGYNLDLILAGIERSTPGTHDGINLAQLVCGAEGTLAVMTQARLNLVKRPAARGLTILSYADVDAAMAALNAILATQPAAVELIDDVVLAMAARNRECSRHLALMPEMPAGSPGALLYVEYFADHADDLDARLDAITTAGSASASRIYRTPLEMAAAWMLRKSGEPLLHAIPGLRKPVTFIEDTAVDPARLGEFVRAFRAIVDGYGTTAAYYAHASVGCLHIRPLVNLHDPSDRSMMAGIARDVTDLVRHFGGAISGEHGDGRARSHLLERYFGTELCEAFAQIKQIFDPRNLLNPGIIVNPPNDLMLSHLRTQPEQRTVHVPDVDTYFEYEHGFGEAVEQCNGAGVCRRKATGTMCPSYRATLDERHATRGRGNALRLAITGQLNGDGSSANWRDRETLATLDLCLSCKACKSECPSNVDIARLKAEYIAQSYRAGARVPLMARVGSHIRAFNRIAAFSPRIANAVNRALPARWVINRALGIDSRRSLPPADRSLLKWFRTRTSKMQRTAQPTTAVLLFADCFTTWSETSIGKAAVNVLEHLNCRVVMADQGCCGRAAISFGCLDVARRQIEHAAAQINRILDDDPAIERIVVLEPSCASALRDDWLSLRSSVNPALRNTIAQRTQLIEEFVLERLEEAEPTDRSAQSSPRILVHGHCHQKALFDATKSRDAIRAVLPGADVQLLDTGCCGLAGSFGYARSRFDLSMDIAELSLFPQVRNCPDALVTAPGTSCRHQLRDGMGRHAMHPIEIIADALKL
ncbi:MAG: FAD-binding and (Fe-S)-binding domain-containing protein [Phycisphaerales bacterium]